MKSSNPLSSFFFSCTLALITLAPLAESADQQPQEDGKQASSTSLEAGFANPAPEYGPRTWWHWLNDNITIDGITKDLEAMKELGYKGAHMVNLPQGGPPETTVTMSSARHSGTPKWITR